jgi:excisionase family DNA binding protein
MNRYYTTFEAAQLLGVSLPTVVNWIKARRIKAHRTPGGHRRIAREDLAAFMQRHGMPVPEELSGLAPGRRKVLVVADAGPGREGLVRQLAAEGYAVEQASPGFAAGAATARYDPDALVLIAPTRDGGETLRAVRGDRELATLPVVAVGPAAWKDDLLEVGVAAFAAAALDRALAEAVSTALELAAPRPGAAAARPGRAAKPRAGARRGARGTSD